MAILATINDMQAATISGGGSWGGSAIPKPQPKPPIGKPCFPRSQSSSVSTVSNNVETLGLNLKTVTTSGFKPTVYAGDQMLFTTVSIG
jgi:hypothetical protein